MKCLLEKVSNYSSLLIVDLEKTSVPYAIATAVGMSKVMAKPFLLSLNKSKSNFLIF